MNEIEKLKAERDAALSKLAAMEQQEPVGVMRASGELGVAPYADIWPWLEPGTPLYAIPADQVLVSRELLERVSNVIWQECISRTGHPSALSGELRALLHP